MNRRALIVFAAAVALAACGPSKEAKADLDAAQTFLTANAHAPGVHVTASGLQYVIVRSGPAGGPHPRPSDEVKVNYEGKLLNGHVFDSSYARGVPADFPVGALIPAWVEALQMMRPGDEWRLYVPPALGYGAQDMGDIPPNSLLIFRMEMLGVMPHPAG